MQAKFVVAVAALAATVLGTAGPALAGKDLDAVRSRGMVNCGVGTGTAGYMIADSQGKWRGLSVDVCRAVAVSRRCSRVRST
jgi:general L-amino acid transport system substrate-binding protein